MTKQRCWSADTWKRLAFGADTFGENYAATEPEGLPSDWLALFVPAPSADGHA